MQLTCDQSVSIAYRSATQKARVISEHWFAANAYCLACESESLIRTVPNTIATDFLCPSCGHRYELKTFRKRPLRSIPDGAYSSFISRIHDGSAPTLCLLERSTDWEIRSLTAIHSSLITDLAIEQRPPLASTARRAGWVGCNIRLDRVPPDGEIAVVKSGTEQPKQDIRRQFQSILPLSRLTPDRRGWTALTLSVLRGLPHLDFTLSDVYARENDFSAAFPNNRHVREKIRQQLQILRDVGVVTFRGNGQYSLQRLAGL